MAALRHVAAASISGATSSDDPSDSQGSISREADAGDLRSTAPRWTVAAAQAVYDMSFADLLFRAQTVHRQAFNPNPVQLSRLMSIKTGGCPEDCGYCSQSARHDSGLQASKLIDVDAVIAGARCARDGGATRYCMGAAWRVPKTRDMGRLVAMVRGFKALGLETCMTLGMLSADDARRLNEAGLDYYNHNIDTSERHYGRIVTTRTFADRLETLANVRSSGIKVCCGGIVGLGEEVGDRVAMLVTLANLDEPPESVPINSLIPIPGTPLGDAPPVDPISFVRTIALARILMPTSYVRLSAGRTAMSDETQALCFLAGANSIFVGDTLLTTDNPREDHDATLFRRKQPPGELLPSAHAVEREYRVMKALEGTCVPVPRMLHFCGDRGVLGTPFYVMEAVNGRVFHDAALPGLTCPQRALAYASVAETLADLHSLDPAALGLADFGKPADYYSRQLRRWVGQYESDRTGDLPGMDRLIAWLIRNLPNDDGKSILTHGDYRIGNVILGDPVPAVRAVLDWELSTLGHPMADLAHCLMFWRLKPEEYGGLAGLSLPELGILSEEEFIACYFARRGLPNMLTTFHRAFALFRFALIAEGVAVRARRGNANSANAEAVGLRAARFTKVALEVVDGTG